MIHFKKAALLVMAASLLASAAAFPALAASKKKVGKIYLTIDSDIRLGNSGGDVEVTPTGDNTDFYYVDYAEVTNDNGDTWSRTNPPVVEIALGLEDEDLYTFSGTSSSSFKLTMGSSIRNRIDKLRFESAKKQDGGATILLTVQLVFDEDADISSISAPSSAAWSDSRGTASWGSVSAAKYYQVQLLKDGAEAGEVQTVYDTWYDFSSQMTEDASYSFKVRAVRSSNNAKSSWSTSKTLNPAAASSETSAETAAETGASDPQGGWVQSADGQHWCWRSADGTYPASQWLSIGGVWYYFNADTYMATGWVTLNGVSYYLDPASGAMLSNQRTPDGYWVDASGAWIPGM